MNDFRGGQKAVDIGTMAVAASLVQSSSEYVAKLFVYSSQGEDQSLDHPTVPVSAIIQSKSGGEQCQLQEYEPFSFLRSEGLKEKDSNDIMLEFRGYKMIDEGLPYVVNTYEGKDFSSNQFGDNAPHSAWVYIFQQTITKYAQKDAELGRAMGRLWPNMEAGELIGSNENTQTFKQLPPQGYKNLGRMLQLVTGKEAAQKLVKGMSDQELREILDAAPKSPVLVIPKASNDAQQLDGKRIWIGKKESSSRWSFVNPLEKEKSKPNLSLDEFKALAEEVAYLEEHSVLRL